LKAAWATQVLADQEITDTVERAQAEGEEQTYLKAKQAATTEKAKANKKKPHLLTWDKSTMVNNQIRLHPFAYAIHKLKGFKYVELWYFALEGHNDATNSGLSASEDTYTIISSRNTIQFMSVATHNPSKRVVQDVNLK
ncbi:hypothetical protein EW146_g8696, partial [Bondarzewia mesenterica]